MFKIILSIFIIIVGIYIIYDSYKIRKGKPIKKSHNSLVDLDKIKDMSGYIKFISNLNCRIGVASIITGIIFFINGCIVRLEYITPIWSVIWLCILINAVWQMNSKVDKFY